MLILTHRIELCGQTSEMLNEFGVKNKIIDSKVKTLPNQDEYMCFVAMVETLNNRLQDDQLEMENVGLVIIDEAHYNSFRKLFQFFGKAYILGVTATPLSSNIKLPMNENYSELIVGHSISSLIEKYHNYKDDNKPWEKNRLLSQIQKKYKNFGKYWSDYDKQELLNIIKNKNTILIDELITKFGRNEGEKF